MSKVFEYFVSDLKADILLHLEYNPETKVYSLNVNEIRSENFTPEQIAYYAEEVSEQLTKS